MFNSTQVEDPKFFIKSGDVGFLDRQKSIFDQLNHAEKAKPPCNPLADELNQPEPRPMEIDIEPVNTRRTHKRNRSEMRQFRGKESIFKRPDVPPPRFKSKSIPDYHKNPHKWVKYSLGDVSQDDMSDRSNSAAAFSFLQEIAARKAAADMEEVDMEPVTNKVAFRRPKVKSHITLGSVIVKPDSNSTTEKVKPSFRSSKLVMPEYVVGQKKKKERKKAELISMSDLDTDSDKVKEIQLGHLMGDIDEDEADGDD